MKRELCLVRIFLFSFVFIFTFDNVYSQFKPDTSYAKKFQPTATQYLFGINFNNPDIYKTFQTEISEHNRVYYLSSDVKEFDCVYTFDGKVYEFICIPTYIRYKQILSYVEIYFGDEFENYDKLSEVTLKYPEMLGIQVERGIDKIHRIYENIYFRAELIWDDNDLKLLVQPSSNNIKSEQK